MNSAQMNSAQTEQIEFCLLFILQASILTHQTPLERL